MSATRAFSERDGRELAVAMLHELDDNATDADGEFSRFSIEAEYRAPGAQQDVSVVLRYLETLRTTGSPELDAGFCAILADFLSTVLEGSVPSPEFYEDFIDGVRS